LPLGGEILHRALVVQHLAVVRPDHARAVPHQDGRSVLAQQFVDEPVHLPELLDASPELLARKLLAVARDFDVQAGQVLERVVAEHLSHGRVGEDDAPLGRGPVEADRHVLDEQTVFLAGPLRGLSGLLELQHLVLELSDEGLAVESVVRLGRLGGFRPRRDLAFLELSEDLLDDPEEAIRILRLDDEAGGSHLERQLPVLRIRVRRGVDDEGNPFELVGLDPPAAERESVHDRHEEVRDDEVREVFGRAREGLLAVARGVHLVSVPLEESPEQVAILLEIVDDEYARHRPASRISATSRAKVRGSTGFSR